MMRICTIVLGAFAVLYLAAVALTIIETFGLFGSPQGPLAGVFLVPLGLPWNLMLSGFSDSAKPWLAGAAPLLNLALLYGICRALGR